MSQSLLSFEQSLIDAEQAALAAKAAAKKQEELDRMSRRFKREMIAREKRDDMVAVCGISFYSCSPHDRARGNQWTHCHRCGKPLRYFDTYTEAQANNRDCRRD